MRKEAIVLIAALAMAPLGAQAADLVVWWEKGQDAEEDAAVREIIAAFEQDSGKQVELVLGPQEELVADLVAALEAGRPTPDFVFTVAETQPFERWAYEGRLVDLTESVGHFSDLFDPDALERATLLDGTTGRRGLYLCLWDWGPTTSTSGRACSSALASPSRTSRKSGTLSGPSGAIRCSRPYARLWAATTSGASAFRWRPPRSTPRTGSGSSSRPTRRNYVTRDGRLVIDDPEVRRRLIDAVDSYTAIYRKGCTPPDSVRGMAYSNNAQFLAQTIVMTPNQTLSTVEPLKRERPDDYYENAVTIDWPTGAYGQPLAIETRSTPGGIQGRRARRGRQGLRPFPGRRGLARALPQLLRRALTAADPEAA